MYPQVTYKVDKDIDVWKIKEFLKHEKRSDYFKKIIYRIHPELVRTDNIEGYIERVYKDNIDNFIIIQKQTQKDWDKLSKDFFDYQNIIYCNIPWPKGEYVGFLSISAPYPRFLDTTTFQASAFSAQQSMAITAHELGHFIFYEFVRNRYIPKLKKLDEEELNRALHSRLEIPLWDLSEVHVVMLMQSPEFQKILPNKSWPYPEHEEYFKKCNTYWQKANGNIDIFFDILEN